MNDVIDFLGRENAEAEMRKQWQCFTDYLLEHKDECIKNVECSFFKTI